MITDNTIIWTEDFSIGNPNIDKEHTRIIELYNEMAENLKNGNDRRKFAEILSGMFDYSMNHFRHEEEYMAQINYPDIEVHKEKHKAYILQVSRMNAGFFTTTPPEPEFILTFLGAWWLNHIQQTDNQYEAFRKNNYPNLIVDWENLIRGSIS